MWEITGIYEYSEFDKSADTIFTNFFDDTFENEMAIGTVKTRRSAPLKLVRVGLDEKIGMVKSLHATTTEEELFDTDKNFRVAEYDV